MMAKRNEKEGKSFWRALVFDVSVGSDVSKGNYSRPDDGQSFANAVRKKVSFADVVERSAVNNV